MAIKKPKDMLLYSINTELAYYISKKYYNDTFFVWCTDAFDAYLQPPTSNPREICSRLLNQILKNDNHACEIKNNKAGILKGAKEKFKQGVISEQQLNEISLRVAYAEKKDFYPIIFLIDKKAVKKRIEVVSQEEAASNKSVEYIIRDLQWNEFEMIRLKDILSNVISPIEE